MCKENFEQILTEVGLMDKKILEFCKTDEELDKLYKGVQVFFSPVIEQADIMFIGINPGQGYSTHEGNGEKVNKIEIPVVNDYYDESGQYTLARIWKNIFFKDLKRPELLKNSVKTNCYFFATSSEDDLTELRKKLSQSKYLGSQLEEQSKKWVKTLIDTIQPLILICEGASAYKFVKQALGINDICEDTEHKYFKYNETTYVCGFWRRYSNFQNEGEILETLKAFIKEYDNFNMFMKN